MQNFYFALPEPVSSIYYLSYFLIFKSFFSIWDVIVVVRENPMAARATADAVPADAIV
jgi:hypothetical protein